MTAQTRPNPRRLRSPAALLVCAVLAACGGGGGDAEGGGGDYGPIFGVCTTAAKKEWLQGYFKGVGLTSPYYLWYATSPNPDPAAYADEDVYFDALLNLGSGALPADRWSGFESTESFNRFFGAGQTLGYGLNVAGLEVRGSRNSPLYVRMVDPGSSAALQGLQRGDEVLSIGGVAAPELIDQITADNFTALAPAAAGEQLRVTVRRGGTSFSVLLTASVYAVTPVSGESIVTTPAGRRMGYLFVRNMVSQGHAAMASAFANFRAQGVSELVLDLRYNGGGLVDTGALLASFVGGAQDNGKVYARLLYNNRQQARNVDVLFNAQANSLNFGRVYVLAGERTCSASEQLVSGLRGVGITVTLVGDTTCGKPVGFLPLANGCGTTYNVVNFEGVNALNEGRYYNGLVANCAVAENFLAPIGGSTDPLLNAARLMADGSACASSGGTERVQSAAATRARRGSPGADGERIGVFR